MKKLLIAIIILSCAALVACGVNGGNTGDASDASSGTAGPANTPADPAADAALASGIIGKWSTDFSGMEVWLRFTEDGVVDTGLTNVTTGTYSLGDGVIDFDLEGMAKKVSCMLEDGKLSLAESEGTREYSGEGDTLVGTWSCTEGEYVYEFEFAEDGTVTRTVNNIVPGTYEVSGGKVLATYDGEVETWTVVIDGDTLTCDGITYTKK